MVFLKLSRQNQSKNTKAKTNVVKRGCNKILKVTERGLC